MAKGKAKAIPVVGSLARMAFGDSTVLVTLIEDRGPLGVGGRQVVRVKFPLDSTEEMVETEVPLDSLELVAGPNDPAERRIGAEAVGDRWVGTYTDVRGRVAIVTSEMSSEREARRAAVRWAQAAEKERPLGSDRAYSWQPHPRYPGRYAVYWESRLGPRLVLEPA
jgi:hypothetical protein